MVNVGGERYMNKGIPQPGAVNTRLGAPLPPHVTRTRGEFGPDNVVCATASRLNGVAFAVDG